MSTLKRWLIVKGAGECRITARRPTKLKIDELAFEVNIKLPAFWGSIVSSNLLDASAVEQPGVVFGNPECWEEAED